MPTTLVSAPTDGGAVYDRAHMPKRAAPTKLGAKLYPNRQDHLHFDDLAKLLQSLNSIRKILRITVELRNLPGQH